MRVNLFRKVTTFQAEKKVKFGAQSGPESTIVHPLSKQIPGRHAPDPGGWVGSVHKAHVFMVIINPRPPCY